MQPVTYENTTEVGNFTHVVEASELNLPVGQWPRSIPTTMGNRQPFIYARKEVREGDLLLMEYRQALGCLVLRVFND